MKPKPYDTEDQSMPQTAEPEASYGRNAYHPEDVISTIQSVSKPGRMTVDEYFDELWSMYLKKSENLQG